MQVPIQITFRNVEASDPIRAYVEKRAAKLESFFERLVSCRVAVESLHNHKSHGHPFRVRIDLTVPGAELVAGHHSGDDTSNADAYAAIDVAFDDAARLLQDYVRRQRGDVKSHEHQRRGKVSKLFPHEGFGFVETPEGDEIYFHRNSVLNQAFDRIEVGTLVRFAEEDGDKGPQASSLAIVR